MADPERVLTEDEIAEDKALWEMYQKSMAELDDNEPVPDTPMMRRFIKILEF